MKFCGLTRSRYKPPNKLLEVYDDVVAEAGPSLDLGRAPYVLYGVEYIDLVTLW